MKYNHDFTEGQAVTDVEHNETFYFKDKTDGYRAEHTEAFRVATEEEKTKLDQSGKDCVSLKESTNE